MKYILVTLSLVIICGDWVGDSDCDWDGRDGGGVDGAHRDRGLG